MDADIQIKIDDFRIKKNEETFTNLYKILKPFLKGYLKKHYRKIDVDDIVSYTFECLWVQRDTIYLGDNSIFYILQIAKHRALNIIKKEKGNYCFDELFGWLNNKIDNNKNPEEILIEKERYKNVNKKIDNMKEPINIIIREKVYYKLSNKEIHIKYGFTLEIIKDSYIQGLKEFGIEKKRYKPTEEHKKKMSKSTKEHWATHVRKKPSKEAIKRMSEVRKEYWVNKNKSIIEGQK